MVKKMATHCGLLGALLVFGSAISSFANAAGPHGGKVVQSKGGEYEVVLDPTAKKVDVYVLSLPHSLSNTKDQQEIHEKAILEIRIPRAPSKGTQTSNSGVPLTQHIQLKAADPWRGMPHYQAPLMLPGQFNTGNTSQKGMEFEIRL